MCEGSPDWFSVKIKTNINSIIKILVLIIVTISRERCSNDLAHYSVPADHTAGTKFGFFFFFLGGGG